MLLPTWGSTQTLKAGTCLGQGEGHCSQREGPARRLRGTPLGSHPGSSGHGTFLETLATTKPGVGRGLSYIIPSLHIFHYNNDCFDIRVITIYDPLPSRL